MLFKTYITCVSDLSLNKYFRSNRIRLVESRSAWNAQLDILEDAAVFLNSFVRSSKKELFEVYCFIESEKIMSFATASILFGRQEATYLKKDLGILGKHLPEGRYHTGKFVDYRISIDNSKPIKTNKFLVA